MLRRRSNKSPSHIAVALHYAEGSDTPPQIAARGERIRASEVVSLARKHGIPIVVDEELARILGALDEGDVITPACFKGVAIILAGLRRARRGARG
jgi:flagellar biosynthesis protein FlhB